MRLPGLAFLLLTSIIGCGKSGRIAEGVPAKPPRAQIPVTEVPSAAPLETLPGAWEPDGDAKWIRRGGATAAPLVVRGVLEPTNADSNMTACPAVLGGRHGTAPLSIHLDGGPRTLYVYAKARGPIGIAAATFGDRCAAAGANEWARLVIPAEYEDVTIPIMDVDVAGERRGQTSPFVVVVSEVDGEPTLEPEPRAAVSASDVVVRWAVTPRACDATIEYFQCSDATIELSAANGKLLKKVPLKKGLIGQLGCWPQGTGVHCGGPSGMTNITLENAPDGSGDVTVLATSESDGYCPPTEDCASRETLTKLTIPRGARLVPDPAGTWPPEITLRTR